MGELVRCDVQQDVATITLASVANRNALSRGLLRALHEALDTAQNASVRAVVVRHEGPTFCAGADLKERADGPVDSSPMVAVLQRLTDFAAPTIAAVDGTVRAGGIGLMAACDLVVVASATTFAFTEVRIGVTPAIISVPILARVQPSLVRTAFLTGETFGAAAARSMGLVTHVADDVPAAVRALVDAILLGSPAALAATKELLRTVPGMERADAYREMQMLSESFFTSADGQEGIAALLGKRRPSWAPDPAIQPTEGSSDDRSEPGSS